MRAVWAAIFAAGTAAAQAQLHPVEPLAAPGGGLRIARPVQTSQPFSVCGPDGAILGRQDGTFETWIWPVKILSGFRIAASLQDYLVPIDVNAHAAAIEVTPAQTVITYSHAAFTIRQHMFATREGSRGAGVVAVFEIESLRPLELDFEFTPDVERMWPAPNFGRPSPEWVTARTGSGYYVLHTDNPDWKAAVGMPQTKVGMLPPYQEGARTYPLKFRLSFDPKRDTGRWFPLLMATGASAESLGRSMQELDDRIPALFAQTVDYYGHFFDTLLTVDTPDPAFDQAMRWAEVSIDQSKVRHGDEIGLVAGYTPAGDSARPGFAWYFGRDSLYTTYALNSTGDFGLTRQALEFLIRRQRNDGKIMHEFSQAADLVDWKSTPYFYAAADSAPLFVMAMEDYLNASGDLAFLRAHWEAVKRAWAFTRAHTDPNGIYTNAQGTGWVESWPPGMPHQEVYLAALDQQSADALSRLAAAMDDQSLAGEARRTAAKLRDTLEREFYEAGTSFYAFSQERPGTLDHTATIFPAVAWWGGRLQLAHPAEMLTRWASPEFSTDWGLRAISPRTSFYDPISYHQGSVWPLFTGWVALAEYRAGRPLAGYQHLMQNADLTWANDPGNVTELLSGEYYQPLGRSTAHQTWSAAMVIAPAIHGLFGLDWDAPHRNLYVSPHLPATWDRASLHGVTLADDRFDLTYRRDGGKLLVEARSAKPGVLCLVSPAAPRGTTCAEPARVQHELTLALPPVEVEMPHGLPLPGARTSQLKAVGELSSDRKYEVTLEAPVGTSAELLVRLNHAGVRVAGAELAAGKLRVRFPEGSGYQRLTVAFEWSAN